ncbi:MAG: hypothetical protein ACYC01_14025 [Lutibacter sp.]
MKQEELNKMFLNSAIYNARNLYTRKLYSSNILQGIYRIKITTFLTKIQYFALKKPVTKVAVDSCCRQSQLAVKKIKQINE